MRSTSDACSSTHDRCAMPIDGRSEEIGIPSIVLMENAGRQAVRGDGGGATTIWRPSQVGVLCGRGNNGGDGFVVARTLVQRGVDVGVFLLGSVSEIKRRRQDQSRSPRPDRPHCRRDRHRAGVGAALHRDLRVRSRCRRDPRHGISRAVERSARDGGGRRERARSADRFDRSADGRVGGHARGRRHGDRGLDDGHARRAEDPAWSFLLPIRTAEIW